MPKVGIIMGSDSDLPVMKEAGDILSQMGVAYEMTVCSAHRLPEETARYASQAQQRGLQVIIAGAGGAAHLPGVVAAYTVLPVIGVPMKTSSLSGLDSLYSIVQMPSGIPVATVAINGGTNAGLLAARMLAIADPELGKRLKDYSAVLKKSVQDKDSRLQETGYQNYNK